MTATPAEQRVVRGGVIVLGVVAVVALVFSALPGYRLTEVDNSDCMDRVFDWHGSHGDEPCVTTSRDLGTEPAGGVPAAFAILLGMLPAYLVWQRGTASSAVMWGGALWLGAIGLFAWALLTYDSSGDGCSGVHTVREPLWPTQALGVTAAVLFFGPMALAVIAAVTRRVTRPPKSDPIPPARVV